MKRELKVVAALMKKDNKFLLCQRKETDTFGLLWEFPGGVVEDNETFVKAIEREVKEELDLEVEAKNLIAEFEDENVDLKIIVYLFECIIKKGKAFAKDCQDFGFFSLGKIANLNLAPVDAKIFNYLTAKKSKVSFCS
jgi:8-oxo-dGTP diphosphatase